MHPVDPLPETRIHEGREPPHGSVLVKLVHCSSNLLAGAALVSNSFRPFRPPADVRCRSERAGLMAGRLPQRVLRLGRHSPTVWLVTYAVERGQAASSQNSWNDFQVRAARASHACPAHSLIQVSRTSVTHRLVRALAAATAARAIAAPQADMYHSCACLAGGSRGGPLASQQASSEWGCRDRCRFEARQPLSMCWTCEPPSHAHPLHAPRPAARTCP